MHLAVAYSVINYLYSILAIIHTYLIGCKIQNFVFSERTCVVVQLYLTIQCGSGSKNLFSSQCDLKLNSVINSSHIQ